MKKRQVLIAIISALGKTFEIIDEMTPDLFRRESMHYKDLRLSGYDPEKIYRSFRNLHSRGLVHLEKDKFKITKKGQKWLANSYQRYFHFNKTAKDNKWRIIIFDIPQEHNKSRNKLRNKLKSWGFYMLQRSVFVCPYECEDELAKLCEKLGISGYVDIILADSPGFRTKEIKKYFEL